MTADKFVALVKKGSDKLRVDEIVLDTSEREIHGKGMLRIHQEEIELDMTLNVGEAPPPFQTGIFTARDFWKLSGLIEDHLRFECKRVARYAKTQTFNGVTTLTFGLRPLDLIPSGWDALSNDERNRYVEQRRKEINAPVTSPDHLDKVPVDNKSPEGCSVEFHALLVDYPLISRDSGTRTVTTNAFLGELNGPRADTFMGEIEGFDFALIKEKEDAELHVHLRSKEGHHSANEEADWAKFDALMNAVAFTHGVHAWPYRIEYWRDGQKKLDRVTPACSLTRTSHAPFTEALFFNAKTGQVQWDLRDPMKKAASFFEANSGLSEEIVQILFLFREAGGEEVHSEIATLALCTLFENLVHLLFEELKLKEKALEENKTLGLFEQAKREIAQQISEQIAVKGEGYNRLHKAVPSLSLFTQREMFQAVVSHFGLKWQDDMEALFKTWKNARNLLVHHKERAGQSEDEVRNSVLDESRIAGVINILLLKLFGYSGWVRSSAFEDKYRQI